MKRTYSIERKRKGNLLSDIIKTVNNLRRKQGLPTYKDCGDGDPWFSLSIQQSELRDLRELARG